MPRSWNSPVLVGGLLAVGIAVLALRGGPLDAARGRAALDISFGPTQVEAFSDSVFVLTLRNLGTKDAALRVGDFVTIGLTSGDTASDLLAAGSVLEPRSPPAGFALTQLTDEDSEPSGLEIAVNGEGAIAPGEAVVFLFDAVSADVGSGVARVATKFSRKAGKVPRAFDVHVTKTAPSSDAFFGDGSDGALVVTAAQDGQELQPSGSYTDFTIEAGVTVTVASGTTIRCTGTFRNDGTLLVGPGATGGGLVSFAGQVDLTRQFSDYVVPWGAGDARAPAGSPVVMQEQAALGAVGGRGLGTAVFTIPPSHYRRGGGGGSAALDGVGADGGGLLRVIARGAIENGAAGVIGAVGAVPTSERFPARPGGGCGGGGGGVVILASALRVQNDGLIDVSGGDGGFPDPIGGGGGGGGGGLAYFAAPLVVNAAPPLGVNVDPGLNGNQQGTLDQIVTIWAGGGGGGACVGNGGDGTAVDANRDVGAVLAPLSEPGQLVIRQADPRTIWR